MILCPNCLHKEMVGAIFCSECGAQLVFEEGVPTNTMPVTQMQSSDQTGRDKTQFINGDLSTAELSEQAMIGKAGPVPPASTSSAAFALNIISANKVLPLPESGEFILGRVSEGQSMLPDIDLGPYKAYEAGVSRMHAMLTIDGERITIMDMESANGTRLNGTLLSPNISYPLKNGDILTLGKFKIQVIFRKQ